MPQRLRHLGDSHGDTERDQSARHRCQVAGICTLPLTPGARALLQREAYAAGRLAGQGHNCHHLGTRCNFEAALGLNLVVASRD